MKFVVVACVLILPALASIPRSSAELAQLNGLAWFSFDLTDGKACDELELSFKTVAASGLLVACSGTSNSSLQVDILGGRLRVAITKSGHYKRIMLGSNWSDNKWHHVKFARHPRDKLAVSVDNEKMQIFLDKSTYAGLQLDKTLFLGGKESAEVANFAGCLRDLHVGNASEQILKHVLRGKCQCLVQAGDCKLHPTLLGFATPTSSASYYSQNSHNFVLQLKFRTHQKRGILVFKKIGKSLLYLLLRAGKLELQLYWHKKSQKRIVLGDSLNDGRWHGVTCSVRGRNLVLGMDTHCKELRLPSGLENLKGIIVFGQVRLRWLYIPAGFVGCLWDVKVNGRAIQPHILSNVTSGTCGPGCQQNPGPHCEEPLVLRATCAEYAKMGLSENAYCIVEPGHFKPVEVLCNITGKDTATVMAHDKIGVHKVDHAAIHHSGAFYHHLTYRLSRAAMRAVIDSSATCRQHVQYICRKSRLLARGIDVVKWEPAQAYPTNSWGGAPLGSFMCPCGINKSCDDPSQVCNCNIGDDTWREDAGYITDKFLLPVLGLFIREEGHHSYFSVGPLECFGSSSLSQNSCVDKTHSTAGRGSSSLAGICKMISRNTTSTEGQEGAGRNQTEPSQATLAPSGSINYTMPTVSGLNSTSSEEKLQAIDCCDATEGMLQTSRDDIPGPPEIFQHLGTHSFEAPDEPASKTGEFAPTLSAQAAQPATDPLEGWALAICIVSIASLVVIVAVAIRFRLFQRAKRAKKVEMGGYNVRAGKVLFQLYKEDYI